MRQHIHIKISRDLVGKKRIQGRPVQIKPLLTQVLCPISIRWIADVILTLALVGTANRNHRPLLRSINVSLRVVVTNRVHANSKGPYCTTTFTRHHNLKSHLLTHSHEKPYYCDTCESRFRRLHDLKRHSKLHTGERPHTCPKCHRSFARGDALARHSKGAGGCAGRRSSLGGDDPEQDEGMQGTSPAPSLKTCCGAFLTDGQACCIQAKPHTNRRDWRMIPKPKVLGKEACPVSRGMMRQTIHRPTIRLRMPRDNQVLIPLSLVANPTLEGCIRPWPALALDPAPQIHLGRPLSLSIPVAQYSNHRVRMCLPREEA